MKQKAVLITLFILLSQAIFSQSQVGVQSELSSQFQSIISLSEQQQAFLEEDLNSLSYEKLFYYFVFVSEQEQFYDQYLEWFKKIEADVEMEMSKRFTSTDTASFTTKQLKAFSESLLEVLHERLFDRYFRTAYSSYWLIKSNTYSCVSSAIMYGVFCRKYQINVVPVETDDHVFVKVQFENNTEFDVETTNKYGFNPGEKKEVLNEFGKLTGFTYVNPQNYSKRRDIDFKKLFLMVFYNSAAVNQQHRKYLKAVQLAYIVKKGRDDGKGDTNFAAHFKNYAVFLMKQKKYEAAVELVNAYLDYFGFSRDFMDLRFDLLHNYVVTWRDYKRIKEVSRFLLRENGRYPGYVDDKRFGELYYYYLCSVLNYYVNNKEYDAALETLVEMNSRYLADERNEDKVYSVLLHIHKQYDNAREKQYKVTEKYLKLFKRVLPEYSGIYDKINDYHYDELINEDFRNKDYEAGIEKFYTYMKIYRNDSRLLAKIKDAYLEIIINHYEKEDYERAIKYNEIALEKFANDPVLTKNLKVLLKKYIEDDYYNTRNYTRSRKTVNKALLYFPDDKVFITFDSDLRKIHY